MHGNIAEQFGMRESGAVKNWSTGAAMNYPGQYSKD